MQLLALLSRQAYGRILDLGALAMRLLALLQHQTNRVQLLDDAIAFSQLRANLPKVLATVSCGLWLLRTTD